LEAYLIGAIAGLTSVVAILYKRVNDLTALERDCQIHLADISQQLLSQVASGRQQHSENLERFQKILDRLTVQENSAKGTS
jgi:hypothetical protein